MELTENEIGKLILVGISYYVGDELLEQYQTSGTVSSVSEGRISIRREESEELFTIPNDGRAIFAAKPGEYRERGSGKIIVNPDFISQWQIRGNGSRENLEQYKRIGFRWE